MKRFMKQVYVKGVGEKVLTERNEGCKGREQYFEGFFMLIGE